MPRGRPGYFHGLNTRFILDKRAPRRYDGTIIIVTNELGMGVHAQTEAWRKFVEVQGWMNQYVASSADTVVLMVSGIPVAIKQPQAGEGAWHVRNGIV